MKNTLNSKLHTSDKGAHAVSDVLAANQTPGRKVFVGMSGGVDSSVSAALLKEAGYDVTGVFIKVWQPDSTDCGWKDERRDAMRVAAVLDIPFLTLDFSEVYKREVVDYMINEYASGRTPNPDVMCNRHVKFGSFLKYAREHGADFVATGHYAQNVEIENTDRGIRGGNIGGTETVAKPKKYVAESVDNQKDQSYFLWTLHEKDLEYILFPIGHLEKTEVRKLAEKFGLPVFDKKDSQGVCFIGHLDMKEFLKEHIPGAARVGEVLDTTGTVIGSHEGAILYTIGERHGFNHIVKNTDPLPLFVIAKDVKKNTITVAPKSAHVAMDNGGQNGTTLSTQIRLRDVNLHSDFDERLRIGKGAKVELECRIRYRQEKQKCTLMVQTDKNGDPEYIVKFEEFQHGLAEGQSLVLYSDTVSTKNSQKNTTLCIGGGIIELI